MRFYTCNCKWSYVIGRRKVFGPLYPDSVPRMMSRKEFKLWYGDCTRDMHMKDESNHD